MGRLRDGRRGGCDRYEGRDNDCKRGGFNSVFIRFEVFTRSE